ncbi:cytochrome c [Thiohalobacter thiocyanaticus]|nr:cytochrome c [Thiohalobacter thiocyanaticus]
MQGTSVIGTVLGLWLLLAGSPVALAGSPQGAAAPLQLPPKLQQALVDEMIAVNDGMTVLPEAIVKADWERIIETGHLIEGSYILNQRLSQAERETLVQSLPTSFKYLDRRLHEHAGKLAQAAERRDGELVRFYFGRMLDSCAGCHAVYAKHRFPGYERRDTTGDHQH